MFLEKQLRKEFHKKAQALPYETTVKEELLQVFERHYSSSSTLVRGHKRRALLCAFALKKVAIFALVFILLTGFAYASTQLLFQLHSDRVHIEVKADPSLKLEYVTGEEIRNTLDTVRSQLAVGKAALVYFAGLEKEKHPLFKDTPGMIVSNPPLLTHEKDLYSSMSAVLQDYKVPSALPANFHFSGGKQAYPFEESMNLEEKMLLDELKVEAQQQGKKILWKTLEKHESLFPVFTWVYQNQEQQNIYITVEKMPEEKIKLAVTTNAGTTYEKITITDTEEFHYTQNTDYLLSPSGYYHSLMWVEKSGEDTLIYQVGSDSFQVSKEDLLLVAQHMQ